MGQHLKSLSSSFNSFGWTNEYYVDGVETKSLRLKEGRYLLNSTLKSRSSSKYKFLYIGTSSTYWRRIQRRVYIRSYRQFRATNGTLTFHLLVAHSIFNFPPLLAISYFYSNMGAEAIIDQSIFPESILSCSSNVTDANG